MVNCSKMVDSVDGVGELLEDLKKHTFEKYDAFTVGEVFNMKADELAEFIGENGHFSSMFDFSAHCLTEGKRGWYEADRFNLKTGERLSPMHSLPRKPVVLRQTLLKTMMNQEVYHAFYQAMHRTRLVQKCLPLSAFCYVEFLLFIKDRKLVCKMPYGTV